MDEENGASNTPSESSDESSQQAAGEHSEQQESPQNNKPEGWEQVEFTPDQQKRFDRLYKQVKDRERESAEQRSILKQQSELLSDLQRSQHQIVSHIQTDDYSRAESQLKSQRDEAFQRGDLPGFNAANDRLLQITAERLVANKLQQHQPQVKPQQYQQGADAVNAAVQRGELSHSDGSAYRAWSDEQDEYGNLKRPWVNSYDPMAQAAASEGLAVFNNPAYRNKSFTEKLSEIDRRMGIMNRNSGQAVMPGNTNLTRQKQVGNIKLSEFQERVAIKTKFAGPGKSEADHLDAYRKQIAKIKGDRK